MAPQYYFKADLGSHISSLEKTRGNSKISMKVNNLSFSRLLALTHALDHADDEFDSAVIESGISAMETFFKNWSSSSGGEDGEDVIMGDDDTTPEAQLEALKKQIEALRPTVEGNPWLKSIITAL